MNSNIPRPEYPRPQFVRNEWINLNGKWDFEIDYGKSGIERRFYENGVYTKKILVPFCPESKLSGIENKDFMAAVWYRREFEVPEEWLTKRVLINFGAVDYSTECWINGMSVGKHKGGYSSFTFDITKAVKKGLNTIVVYAEDDVRSGCQPRGKQSSLYYSHGCDYTRSTGIWQTVWLEAVSLEYIKGLKYIPDPDNGCLHLEASVIGDTSECTIKAAASYNGRVVGEAQAVVGNRANFTIKLSEIHLWEPGKPELYDLKLVLSKNDRVIDSVESYFGLRSVTLSKEAILINNKAIFQRLVLDQGFYPDGIYTAPADEDLKKDIEISLGLGFNGARLHQKVFDPRFLYWADKLGYIVWGEHGNWGLNISTAAGLENFLPEWMEVLERDFNHPSIVGWCPFNETWDSGNNGVRQDNEVLRITYNVTKAVDYTRPVIDTSGNFHVVTDIFDIHDYEQEPEKFAAKFEAMKNGGETYVTFKDRQKYEGQPYFVSEYGGIWWDETNQDGWGYGERPTSGEEFIERYKNLTDTLLSNPRISAFCYTQLYDVEQEVNGLYTYERKPKFDPKIFKDINSKKAEIEK